MTIQKYNKKRSELIKAVYDMSLEDLQDVIEAIKLRRTYLHASTARSFTKVIRFSSQANEVSQYQA